MMHTTGGKNKKTGTAHSQQLLEPAIREELQPSLPGLPLGQVDKVRLECQRRKRLLEPAIREEL